MLNTISQRPKISSNCFFCPTNGPKPKDSSFAVKVKLEPPNVWHFCWGEKKWLKIVFNSRSEAWVTLEKFFKTCCVTKLEIRSVYSSPERPRRSEKLERWRKNLKPGLPIMAWIGCECLCGKLQKQVCGGGPFIKQLQSLVCVHSRGMGSYKYDDFRLDKIKKDFQLNLSS